MEFSNLLGIYTKNNFSWDFFLYTLQYSYRRFYLVVLFIVQIEDMMYTRCDKKKNEYMCIFRCIHHYGITRIHFEDKPKKGFASNFLQFISEFYYIL